jgi:hypothetical protein
MKRIAILFILLSFVLTLPAKKIAELESVSRPERIVIDKNALYVLEDTTVYIYSLKDYHLIKKFGKKGNGPGELSPLPNYKLQIEVNDGDLFLNSRNKIITFSTKGEFIREKRIPFIALQVIPIQNNFAITKSVFSERGGNSTGLFFFDSQFNEIKTAYNRHSPHYSKSGKIDLIPLLVVIRKYKNKIYCCDQTGDFEINIYNKAGKRIDKIKTEYKKRKIPQDYIDKTLEWVMKDIRLRNLPEEQRKMIYFPDYFPIIKNYLIEDNKIFIHTYNMKPEEDKSQFIIIDLKGKILKEIYLRGADLNTIEFAPYIFLKGEYLYLYDNPETESIELHSEKIW